MRDRRGEALTTGRARTARLTISSRDHIPPTCCAACKSATLAGSGAGSVGAVRSKSRGRSPGSFGNPAQVQSHPITGIKTRTVTLQFEVHQIVSNPAGGRRCRDQQAGPRTVFFPQCHHGSIAYRSHSVIDAGEESIADWLRQAERRALCVLSSESGISVALWKRRSGPGAGCGWSPPGPRGRLDLSVMSPSFILGSVRNPGTEHHAARARCHWARPLENYAVLADPYRTPRFSRSND